MSTNTPNFIKPASPEQPERQEEHYTQPVADRPKERSTPTQQGQFLRELEKPKKKEKSSKTESSSHEVESEEDVEGSETQGGVFGLAAPKERKKEKSLQDFSGESTNEEEQKLYTPSQKPTKEQEAAARYVSATQYGQIQSQSGQIKHSSTEKAPSGSHQVQSKETLHYSDTPYTTEKKSYIVDEPEDFSKSKPGYTAPVISQQPIQGEKIENQPVLKSAESRAAMVSIIEQTIEAMRVMKTKAETTITIEIKQPPLFAGASLQIVETHAAKGEFNITFSNLTPEARRIIELQVHQTQLHQALIDKGYTLRNIVIAPDITFKQPSMPTITTEKSSPGKENQGQGREGYADTNESFQGKQ